MVYCAAMRRSLPVALSFAALLAVLAAAACSQSNVQLPPFYEAGVISNEASTPDAGSGDDGSTTDDAAADGAADAPHEAATDGAADAGGDAGGDAAGDAGADVPAESGASDAGDEAG